MMPPSAAREAHNGAQRGYFEATIKPTMVPSNSPYVRRQVEKVLRFGGIADGARVLEVGCGMGRYTLALAERGIVVEGLDLSPVLLERLRAFAGDRYDIPLHCVDVTAPPPTLRGRFDAVIGFFTLHHLHDLEASMRGLAGILPPGAPLVFLEPNPYNVLYYAQILASPGMTWAGDGGIIHMRRRRVFDAMERAGLRNPLMDRFGFLPPALANRGWGMRVETTLERVPAFRPFLPFQLFRAQR